MAKTKSPKRKKSNEAYADELLKEWYGNDYGEAT